MIKDTPDLVFSVANSHVDECGSPPAVHDPGSGEDYIGYFRNRFGEQWVVKIDPNTKTGILRGGDIGWEREIELNVENMTGGVILGKDESQWLTACWMAACGDSLTS